MSNESQGYTGPIPVAVISQAHFDELARGFDASMRARTAILCAPFNAQAAADAPSVLEQQFVSTLFRNACEGERLARKARTARAKGEALKQCDDAGCCGRCEKPAGDSRWVSWTGGERPVDGDAMVEYRTRGSSIISATPAKARALVWRWDHAPYDIMAYRVIDAGKKAEPTAGANIPPELRQAIRRAADRWTPAELQEWIGGAMKAIVNPPPPPPPADPAPTAANFLAAAGECMGQRAAEYDSPQGERSIPAVVTAFNAITGHGLTEAQGWCFLALLKAVRLFSAQDFHRDSAVDGVAYSALMAEARAQEAG